MALALSECGSSHYLTVSGYALTPRFYPMLSGGENCHTHKELEPFPFPGGKQQFKMPASISKGNFQ